MLANKRSVGTIQSIKICSRDSPKPPMRFLKISGIRNYLFIHINTCIEIVIINAIFQCQEICFYFVIIIKMSIPMFINFSIPGKVEFFMIV